MRKLLFALFMLPLSVSAQRPVESDGRQAMSLSNDKIDLTVLLNGGTLARLVLSGDPEKISPLAALGHFLCLDGFGAPSSEEMAAGMPFHGEASKQLWTVTSSPSSGKLRSVRINASLPLAREIISRRFEIVDGENVIYVESELENLVAVDRPVSWAEHATIGPPFLEKGKLVVDMPAAQCRVRAEKPHAIPNRLVFLRDFTWPMAPAVDGGQADLRSVPEQNYLDLASCQMDPKRTLGFVTALHLGKHLMFGYVFRREEYPWVMSWMNYTGNARAARGMEFSTQPFDVSRRETVEANPMFGTPTFRWLPAKSKIRSRFLLFYARAPEGFTKVDDITLAGGVLTIEDRTAGKRITLPVSLPL
jgi:hypothetical protein